MAGPGGFLELVRSDRRARQALFASILLGGGAAISALLCTVVVPAALRTTHWTGWAFAAIWLAFPLMQLFGLGLIWAWPAWTSRRRMLLVAALAVGPLAAWVGLLQVLEGGPFK